MLQLPCYRIVGKLFQQTALPRELYLGFISDSKKIWYIAKTIRAY